jgi:BlaR1 peptidase M56
MDRELVLAIFALTLVGGAYVACGAWAWRSPPRAEDREAQLSAQLLEQRAWRRLWMPLVPGSLLLAFLLGWALQEPDAAEELHLLSFVVALPFALLWGRASLRAWRSRSVRTVSLAGTIGLWRPRVVISQRLHDKLDPAALHGVLEHEAAHARHRDPLRLWLAQIATDLQWPAPAARLRLGAWRTALELARDEEACARGVDGGDLAAALVTAARLGAVSRPAMVGLVAETSSEAFRQRVLRLLNRERQTVEPVPRGPATVVAFLAIACAVAALGHSVGEAVVTRFADLGL